MENKLDNSISTNLLFKEFDWYEKVFPEIISQAWDEFFDPNFKLKFIALSKNLNCLMEKDACFVTKIKINDEYDIFFRLNDVAVDVMLTTSLGKSKNKFNLNKMTDLEVKVITSFNDYVFEALKDNIKTPPQTELKRLNFDVINLTFVVKSNDEHIKPVGKFMVSIPLALLEPVAVESSSEKFSKEDFDMSELDAKIMVGKTSFSLFELKNIESGDVVVFENSSIRNVVAVVDGQELEVNLNPNMDILVTDEDSGGEDMGDTDKNIWDSIAVDMSAEFESVKISLGELKNIESGLVVDLASLYNNKVTLKVENKPIATGSLVIVNDRYGVKVEDVLAQSSGSVSPSSEVSSGAEGEDYDEQEQYSSQEQGYEAQPQEEGEEEFDYSDFELEDENI